MEVRKVASWAIGFAVVVAFLVLGIVVFTTHEAPRGSFVGVVYSEATLRPIPNAVVQLVSLEEMPSEPESPLGGWEAWYQGQIPHETWEVRTDRQGRFEFRNLPAGRYELYAYSQIHSLPEPNAPLSITLSEGERVEQTLYLKPQPDSLSLIHPQSFYTPEEPLRLGVRGHVQSDDMIVRLFSVQLEGAQQLEDILRHLSNIRYGWWDTPTRLASALEDLKPVLKPQWERTVPIQGRDAEGQFIQYLELPQQPAGLYLVHLQAGTQNHAALLVISRVGTVVKQAHDRLEVWSVDLRTGKPIPNTPLSLIERARKANGKPLEALTNAQGLYRFRWKRSSNGEQHYLLFVRDPQTKRITHWHPLYYHDYPEQENAHFHGVLYTDRPLYRPGHTVHFKGIVRMQTAQGYLPLPEGTPVELTVYTPRREVLTRQTLRTTAFSSFYGSFSTTPEAQTGRYAVEVSIPRYGSFEDAVYLSAYRKPTYRVEVKPSRTLYLPNETVEIAIDTQYYFGMPVPNTQVRYTLYHQYTYYRSWEEEDAEEDGFGDDWYDYSEPYGQVILEDEAKTDAQGRLILRFDPARLIRQPSGDREWLEESTAPQQIRVSVVALSEGRESAEGSATFKIAPSVWDVRLRPVYSFGSAGVAYKYEVEVRHQRTGEPVQTTLRWQAGELLWEGNRRTIRNPLSGTVRTDAEGKGYFEFIPTTPGTWEVRVQTTDPARRTVTATSSLWLWGTQEGYYAEQPPDSNLLDIRLQRRSYQPGEQAELAIRCPVPDAVFYVTLEGETLYHSQVVARQGILTRVKIPVTHANVPSAYVNVCMVHKKEFHERSVLLRVGTAQGELNLTVQTDQARYEPRSPVQVLIKATDAQGRPVQAELSLAVVDEGIFALASDSPRRLWNAFYARRYNQVLTDFSSPYLALQGDKGATEVVRKEFPDTAYWLPTLVTDSQGIARARFVLPDSLTEWRLTVYAHTLKTQLGYAKSSIRCSKDLVVRMRAPLWLAEGDRTEISTLVSNDTAQSRTVVVELQTPEGSRSQQILLPAQSTRTLNWSYEAKAVGTHRLIARVRDLNSPLRDAEERTVEVKPLAYPEVATRTFLLGEPRAFTLKVEPDARMDISSLELHAYASPLELFLQNADYLLEYPYGCAEQTASRFVPPLLLQRAYQQMGLSLPSEMNARIATITRMALDRLARLQNEDGGWGWWEGRESQLWLTAYVVRGLLMAKANGVAVPPSLYQGGLEALSRTVENALAQYLADREVSEEGYGYSRATELFFGLAVLAEASTPPLEVLRIRQDALSSLVRHAQQSGNESQIARLFLLTALLRWNSLPNAPTTIRTLWDDLLRNAREDSNTLLWGSDPYSPYEWNHVETQAIALQALVLSKPYASALFGSSTRYHQMVSKTALGLLLLSQGGYWYSSRDTALAMEALLAYLRAMPSARGAPESACELWVNGRKVQEIRLNLQAKPIKREPIRLSTRLLRSGENTFELRPVRGAPLVSVKLVQMRPLEMRNARRPAGPLQVRLFLISQRDDPADTPERLREVPLGGVVPTGALIRIDVEATLPANLSRLDYSVLEVPFPAGCAPVETDLLYYAGWWSTDYEDLRDDRAISFRSAWHNGNVYRYSLIVRAEVPGTYTLLPSHLWGMYKPYGTYGNPYQIAIRER